MAEKRLMKRVSVKFPAAIYEAVNQSKIAEGCICNLSLNGVGMTADVSMGVGSLLLVEFKLPKYSSLDISIKSKVEIKWQASSETCVHYGVRFIEADPVTKSRLRNFIESEINKRKYTL